MASMRIERANVGWRLWLQWVLANAVAGALALSVTGTMIIADSLNNAMVVGVFGMVIGVAFGITQWLVLRPQILQAYLWVLASVVGGVVLAVLGFAMGGAVGGPLGGAVIGGALGIIQWLVLRQRVSRAYLYLPASIVGFALALSVGEAVGFTVGGAAGWLAGGTMFGIAAGIITGAALVFLLRRTISDS